VKKNIFDCYFSFLADHSEYDKGDVSDYKSVCPYVSCVFLVCLGDEFCENGAALRCIRELRAEFDEAAVMNSVNLSGKCCPVIRIQNNEILKYQALRSRIVQLVKSSNICTIINIKLLVLLRNAFESLDVQSLLINGDTGRCPPPE
jgi:hypothetical protein